MITQEELKEQLDYNSETGVFTWKVSNSNKIKIGQITGTCLNTRGFGHICVKGKLLQVNRLAWLYVYGEWPKGVINHINGVKTDNRIENLEDTTRGKITRKTYILKPIRGSYYNKKNKKWHAQISINGKSNYLGYFETKQEANRKYMEVYNKLIDLKV